MFLLLLQSGDGEFSKLPREQEIRRGEGGSVNYEIYFNFHSNALSENESVIFYSSIFASSED